MSSSNCAHAPLLRVYGHQRHNNVTIMVMVVAVFPIIRELLGLYRDTQDDEDTNDFDGS